MTAATPSTVVLRSCRMSGRASVTIEASARPSPAAMASARSRALMGAVSRVWTVGSQQSRHGRGPIRGCAGSAWAVSSDRQALLDAIADEIRSHGGCGFDVCAQATNMVPGEGSATAAVVVVGEAPGASEDAQGRPFVGRAGKLLDELLTEAGLARDEVFITNVLKARPPGNRDPRADEVAHHLAWLEAQLE